MTIKALIPVVMIGVLCVPAAARAQDEVIYFHTDAIGSVRATTNNSGAVQARYDYLPFGELWEADPPAAVEVRQFAGKEREKIGTHDLDYFGARYHFPVTGRFTTVDPVLAIDEALFNPQRWNRYAYALNNPLQFIDPDGRNAFSYLALLLQRAAASPSAQRAQQWAQQTYVWATRFFSSSTGQELTQAAAETFSGASLPGLTGNISRLATTELATGLRLAQQLKQTLRVSDHIGAEFVSAAGKTYDAMGTPAAYAHWNQSEFFSSINHHLTKADFTVIDLTGASKSQVDAIRGYVTGLQKALQDKVMFVGELF